MRRQVPAGDIAGGTARFAPIPMRS